MLTFREFLSRFSESIDTSYNYALMHSYTVVSYYAIAKRDYLFYVGSLVDEEVSYSMI